MRKILLPILLIMLSLLLFSCNKGLSTDKYQVTELKTLFGSDIPQAAIFISNDANKEDVAVILGLIKENINYLNNKPQEFAANAVTKHQLFANWGQDLLTNLLPNAGIKYELNKEEVSNVLNLLEVKNFKDQYYENIETQNKELKNEIKIVVPSGLPFLALSNLIGMDKVEVNNVTGDQIPAALTKGEASIVIAPINAGCKLIGAGKANYKLESPITFNNAFLVTSQNNKHQIKTVNDLDSLTIHAFNEAGIPSAVLKYLFSSNNLNMANVDFTQQSSAAILAAYKEADLTNEYILISEPELSKLLNETK